MKSSEYDLSLAEKYKNEKFSKFRIAICLSGQARYWYIALKNIKYYFGLEQNPYTGMPVETDYFIHTWDTNTWRKPKEHHHVFENVKHNDKDKIVEGFQPKGFIQEEYLAEKYIRAWDPMFYSHAQSLMLKRNYELEYDFEYDLVVKARLDVIYDPATKFPLQKFYPSMTCYSANISKFPSEFNSNCFDDVVFWGNSPTMDLVGDQYHSFILDHDNVQKYRKASMVANISGRTEVIYPEDKDVTTKLGPGTLLYDHMKKMEIRPEKFQISYAVIRSTAVTPDVDSIRDYHDIRSKLIDWYV